MKISHFHLKFLLIFGAAIGASSASAQELTIGVPEFSHDINLIQSRDPVAWLARRATTATLTRISPELTRKFQLAQSDSMTVSPDRKTWSFRLDAGSNFSNGEKISAEDAKFSLLICRDSGQLSLAETVAARRSKSRLGRQEEWVDISIYSNRVSTLTADALPTEVANCPLYESLSGKIFGRDLGLGTNFISSGPYIVSGWVPGREFHLAPKTGFGQVGTGLQRIVLRGFSDASQSLAALRIGTLDGFYCKDPAVLETAAKDETLALVNCEGNSLVIRKNLRIPCTPWLDLTKVRYES